MLLLYANAPSALSTLFGRFWVVLPARRSQSKEKHVCWNVEGPVFFICATVGSVAFDSYTYVFLCMFFSCCFKKKRFFQ